MERRKCFIGVVAFQGVSSPVLENYMALAFNLGRRHPEWDFLLRVVGKREQFRARNNLVAMAVEYLTGEDDLMWFLDDDMIVPPLETFARLLRVLETHPDAGVAGGLYWQRGGTYRPVIQKLIKLDNDHGEPGYLPHWYAKHEITGGIQQVGILGGGCMLIRIKALRMLMPPVFWVDGIVGTDIHFCVRLNQAGWNAYCDTGLELGHQLEGQIINSRTLPPFIKKYSNMIQKIEVDACEYLRMDRMQLEDYALAHLQTIENYWLRQKRDTFDEIAEVYTGVGISAIARNVFYSSNNDTGIEGFAAIIDCIDCGMINRDYPCIDYGCGIGVATEILAHNGYQVEAYDLKDTAVLDFLEWRMKKDGYQDKVKICPVTDLRPQFSEKYSMVIMLDILEHLMNPQEILEDLLNRLIPGGHFHTNFDVMDMRGADEGVHQHLKRITREEFKQIMEKHRMLSVGTFTHVKRRDEEYEHLKAANLY